MRIADIPAAALAVLRKGSCIPAHLLALDRTYPILPPEETASVPATGARP